MRERVRGIRCRSEAIAYELNDSIDRRGAVKCREDVGDYEIDENGKCFVVCRLRRMVMKKNQKQREIFDWGVGCPP